MNKLKNKLLHTLFVNEPVRLIGHTIEKGRWGCIYNKYQKKYDIFPTIQFSSVGTKFYNRGEGQQFFKDVIIVTQNLVLEEYVNFLKSFLNDKQQGRRIDSYFSDKKRAIYEEKG